MIEKDESKRRAGEVRTREQDQESRRKIAEDQAKQQEGQKSRQEVAKKADEDRLASEREAKRHYEVMYNAELRGGESRSSHRYHANREFARRLEADPVFREAMNDHFKCEDVLKYMKEGKGQLKNPPGHEWHHPKKETPTNEVSKEIVEKSANTLQLLRKEVHRGKEYQSALHEERIGGFGEQRKMKTKLS